MAKIRHGLTCPDMMYIMIRDGIGRGPLPLNATVFDVLNASVPASWKCITK